MKISKTNASKFYVGVQTFIVETMKGQLVSTVFDGDTERYEVNTNAGQMLISLSKTQEQVYTIFCRFRDVEKARQKYDCNPYSGKYNFHAIHTKVGAEVESARVHLESTIS